MANRMLLALDESGNFAVQKDSKKIAGNPFIAGFVFECPDDANLINEERLRIKEYLKMLCRKCDTSYPEGLHTNRFGDDDPLIKKLFEEAKKSLPCFLKTGHYSEKEKIEKNGTITLHQREGKYHLFASILSRNGKTEFLTSDKVKLMDDRIGDNLYIHVVQELLLSEIFHNPHHDIENLDILIAERGSQSNQDAYRAFFNREALHYGVKTNVIKSVSCLPIAYTQNTQSFSKSVKNPFRNKNMPFLFLADILNCALYDHEMREAEDEVRIDMFYKKLLHLCDTIPFLIGYGDVDSYYSRAQEAYETGNYFDALSISYDAMQLKEGFVPFYKEKVFPVIKKRIIKDRNVHLLDKAINDLEYYVNHTENLDQRKLLALINEYYDIIHTIACETDDKAIQFDPGVMYRFFLAGQAAYNHIGNPKEAYRYYQEAQKITGNISLEMRLQARRQMIVSSLDGFQPETIRKYAIDTLEAYLQIREAQNKYFHLKNPTLDKDPEYGMLLSQIGQVNAFLRSKNTEVYFHEALKHLRKSEANYNRTLTYLLHHYIDMNNREAYSKWAPELFGKKKNIIKQYEWILSQAGKDTPFTLDYLIFVYIKALYTFYFDEAEAFPDFAREFDKHKIVRKEHPWELIDKYLAFFELEKEIRSESGHARSEKLIEEMKHSLSKKAYTTDAIIQYGEIQYLQALGNPCEDKIVSLYKMIHETSENATIDFNYANKDLKNKRFVYMHI